MIIHAVRTNEDDCLIIREKTKDYVKRPKQFIAKHNHWYKILKQRQHRRQLETNLNHTIQSKGRLYPSLNLKCIRKLYCTHKHVYSDL